MGPAAGGTAPPASADRSVDERAVGLPRVALVPVRLHKTADDTDGAPVKPLPVSVDALARQAIADAYGADSPEAARYEPDAAIVNLYPPGAHLGLHQDGEEPSDAPVVTISLGDTCTFRLAGIDRRTGPFVDIEMRSGDLLVFGRENRRIFHGVPKVFTGTAPDGLGLPDGRLSITVRETGLSWTNPTRSPTPKSTPRSRRRSSS